MDLGLAGKIAIVTGSTRGLGLAIATALVQEGCRVTVCARGEDGIAAAVETLRTLPGGAEQVLAVQADLSTDKGVADVILRTVETFGGLDILVNNIGLARGSDIVSTTDAEWHEAFDQTLFPAVRASRMAVPQMRRRGGGSIVMIASIWGRESGGRMTYNAVKAAEISLAKAMAQQLAKDNIRVNSVAPGSIAFLAGRGTSVCGTIPRGWPNSSAASCRSGALAAPRKSGRSSRSWCPSARAGSAGQACPLTAASHAP
jgi:3-oxoacyl-[acyl-carrier protein] reductase